MIPMSEAADDLLEREADALAEIFNEASPDYAPELEWFAMSHDRETDKQRFVFEAFDYIDTEGLQALRQHGRTVQYIEAYEYGDNVSAQVHIPVQGSVPTAEKRPSGNDSSGGDR